MAETSEVRAGRRSVSLDVDRLELTGDGSLVIEGRWYGVRGRRFVRPTVMLFAGGERSRLLADIEHKPWAAEDGELWLAVFPWKFDQATDMGDMELSVAPDIVVPLPPPDAGVSRRRRSDGPRPKRSVDASLRRQLDGARTELAGERERVDRLQAELERAQAAKARESAVLARRETSAVEKIDELAGALDAALAGRHAAIAERDIVDAEREAAIAQRNTAVTERQTAISECNMAALERRTVIAERQAAVADRDRAIAERDQAVREARQLTSELHELRRMTTAPAPPPAPELPADPRPVPTPAAPPLALTSTRPPTFARPLPAQLSRSPGWPARIVAVAVLLAVRLALAIILGLFRP